MGGNFEADDQIAYRGGSKGFYDKNPGQLIDPASLYSDPNMGGGAKGGRQGPPEIRENIENSNDLRARETARQQRNYYSGDNRFTQDQGLSMSRADDIVNQMGEMPMLSQAESKARVNQANSEVQRLTGLRDQLRLDPNNVDIQKQMGIYNPENAEFMQRYKREQERGLGSIDNRMMPILNRRR